LLGRLRRRYRTRVHPASCGLGLGTRLFSTAWKTIEPSMKTRNPGKQEKALARHIIAPITKHDAPSVLRTAQHATLL